MLQPSSHQDIKGKITTADGKPAEFVTVILKGTGKGAVTNEEGNYQVTHIKPGKYQAQASIAGIVSWV